MHKFHFGTHDKRKEKNNGSLATPCVVDLKKQE